MEGRSRRATGHSAGTFPGRPPAVRSTSPRVAVLLILLLAAAPPAVAQFEAGTGDISEDAILSGYPTIEGIRRARAAGHPVERILTWIRVHDALFDLDLDEAMQLHAEGLEVPVIAAMAQMPETEVAPLLETFEKVYVARTGPREGLSKRRLMQMMEYGAPESEILAAIAEKGSRAELTLAEAVAMMQGGASPRLVAAIGRGIVPPEAGQAAAPMLDDLLAGESDEGEQGEEGDEEGAGEGEEGVALEEIFEEEGIPVEPEGAPRLVVLSDPPGARISIAPATIRPADLLTLPRSQGRTPAEIRVDPGAWYVLVEKPLDGFDTGIVPALRTVHDGDGGSRTLIQEGTLYYDVQHCCRPRALTGTVEITRIAEDQPGTLLGDEFEGLPPYLWDGNRYLILTVERGVVRRVIKVYLIKRAAAEERTLMASFIPSSAEPLDHAAAPEAVSTRARTTWEVPSAEGFAALAKILGLPEADAPKLHARLLESGKALWRKEDDAGFRIVSFGLDSMGRLRVDDVPLERTDLYGMLETPRRSTKRKTVAEKEPGPLPAFRKVRRPGSELPVIEISNHRSVGALVRLGDGTTFYVAPGETVTSQVSPGTYVVEGRFDGGENSYLQGRARFSYNALYRLSLN